MDEIHPLIQLICIIAPLFSASPRTFQTDSASIEMATLALTTLFILASIALVQAYNRPHCSGWPSSEEWDALADELTPDAALHGPFRHPDFNYFTNCYLTNQERVVLLDQGRGLCMTEHNCANDNCQLTSPLNLPVYSLEAHDVEDVQAAIRFANTHNIGVSVKSSGHSFEGQSTSDDSLLIWMRHFRQDPVVHTVNDSCGNSYTTVRVAGGQNFDDTFFHIKNDYHISSGTCQTVVLGGGWIHGGGVSWTSRMYGYGVDNVVSMEVVLADGSLVTADACNEHADLFWALRGGGGGNFGILTSMEYIAHPATKIVVLEFKYDERRQREFATQWMDLIISEAPGLDRRWGGAWSPVGCRFMFAGSKAEAEASTWMQQIDQFYESVADLEPNFSLPSTLLIEYDGFHDQNGGDLSHNNPDFDGVAQTVPTWYEDSFSRVLPVELLQEKPIELRDLIVDMWVNGETVHPQNYIFGGRTMDTAPDATAIHPGMRRGVLEFRVRNERGRQRIDALLEGYTWSVCYNHHSVNEPNYEEAAWGDNYARLLDIKARYDPNHRFNVHHGVDYRENLESPGCSRRRQYGVLGVTAFYSRFGPTAIVESIFDSLSSLFRTVF